MDPNAQGNLRHSMRANYQEHGVDEYYKKVQTSYRNPFYPGIVKVVAVILDRWLEMESSSHFIHSGKLNDIAGGEMRRTLKVLDLAAGSGEATLAIESWFSARGGHTQPGSTSYDTRSSDSSPLSNASAPTSSLSSPNVRCPSLPAPTLTPGGVINPLAALNNFRTTTIPSASRPAFIPPARRRKDVGITEPALSRDGDRAGKVAGNGTAKAGEKGPESFPVLGLEIVATDPFTAPAYEQRIGKPCLPLSFNDIAEGMLPPLSNMVKMGHHVEEALAPKDGTLSDTSRPSGLAPSGSSDEIYDIVICSFALHLILEPSELFALLSALSRRARWLIVLAPHKKPEIKDAWGFERWHITDWRAFGDDIIPPDGGSGVKTDKYAAMSAACSPDGLELTVDKVRCRLYRSRAV